jgi:hypothetical protein
MGAVRPAPRPSPSWRPVTRSGRRGSRPGAKDRQPHQALRSAGGQPARAHDPSASEGDLPDRWTFQERLHRPATDHAPPHGPGGHALARHPGRAHHRRLEVSRPRRGHARGARAALHPAGGQRPSPPAAGSSGRRSPAGSARWLRGCSATRAESSWGGSVPTPERRSPPNPKGGGDKICQVEAGKKARVPTIPTLLQAYIPSEGEGDLYQEKSGPKTRPRESI